MKRTLIQPDLDRIPSVFHSLFLASSVYDSSCSSEAKVLYVERDGGYFLKSAPKGSLEKEATLTRFFHTKQLAANVLAYESLDQDWLLTTRVPGEDCTHAAYLSAPKKLCDTTAELLRHLHDMEPAGCPIPNQLKSYLATATRNFDAGRFHPSRLTEDFHHLSTDEVWQIVENNSYLLKTDTLLHGDYCLPNIILNDWHFSGFIDLDNGGIGDRHIDLYWALWSLRFNLKSDRYSSRFLDVYGRDKVDVNKLKLVSAIEAFD